MVVYPRSSQIHKVTKPETSIQIILDENVNMIIASSMVEDRNIHRKWVIVDTLDISYLKYQSPN